MQKFGRLTINDGGAVVEVLIHPPHSSRGFLQWELADFFGEIRGSTEARVITVTGAEDGIFVVPREWESEEEYRSYIATRNNPDTMWRTFGGVVRCHEAMLSLEKPIVAKINGNAIGFGSTFALACDFTVAREDAVIQDSHLAVDDASVGGGFHVGLVPGDGGGQMLPTIFPPAMVNEFLMLARPYRASELAARGFLNYAVPADEVETVAKALVDRLIQRPAQVLGWTKRLINAHRTRNLAGVLDAGVAYEMIGFERGLNQA